MLALVEEPSFSGSLIKVRPIGMLKMIDRKKRDEKIYGGSQPQPSLR